MTGIPAAIREVLACPRCRGALRDAPSGEPPALLCDTCGVGYPVVGGIPVLIKERALPRAGA